MAKKKNNGANLGFESELWRAADALRSNMDATMTENENIFLWAQRMVALSWEVMRYLDNE